MLDAWLKGATVRCIDCELEPETDPWGQIWSETAWVHVGRDDYMGSMEPLPCSWFMLLLLSNLSDGSLADVTVEL